LEPAAVIRISKKADYGIILLGQFVTDSSATTCNARDLSGATRLPLPMVGKILKSLVRTGLLVSHRGVKGGYSLARPAETISVAEIITALDGPIGLTTCSSHSGDCEYENGCPARGNWHVINRAIFGALKSITLKEMARPEAPLFRPTVVPGKTPATTVVACTCGMAAGCDDHSERFPKEMA
jgi:FeS assembly SUF system regulator